MDSLAFSFFTALTGPEHYARDEGKILVIVPRAHAYLADMLARMFAEREDIEVIVDRRQEERRSRLHPVAVERRRRDRRRAREEIVQVVVEKPPRLR